MSHAMVNFYWGKPWRVPPYGINSEIACLFDTYVIPNIDAIYPYFCYSYMPMVSAKNYIHYYDCKIG